MKNNVKTSSAVTRERVIQMLRMRYEPLATFTPQRLVQLETQWDSGDLRHFALALEKIMEADDILKGVSGKRCKAPSVRGWEIVPLDESEQAKRDAEALKYFYDNLTVTSAMDENERGGVAMLTRQMMLAVGLRYSAHEIVWQPSKDGITATLRHVPLYFFENTTGRLRFLPSESSWQGVDLEDGGWMVTVGDFLMRSCARAYLYKHMPLRDWLIYCGRHGMPGIAGKTDAAPGSTEWNNMEDAVEQFAAEFAVVLSREASLEKIDMTSAGALPYPGLVERMDRAMAALWRGSDLSTLSQGGDANGASVQGDESEILVASDALMISEACQYYLDRHVIYMASGEWRKPLAYFAIKGVTKKNTDQDLKIDRQLWEMGVPVSMTGIQERYGRPAPQDDADRLAPKAPGAEPALQIEAANAASAAGPDSPALGQLLATAKLEIAEAVNADLMPVARAIHDLLKQADDADMSDADFQDAVRSFYNTDMPALAEKALGNKAAAEAFGRLFASTFMAGLAEGKPS